MALVRLHTFYTLSKTFYATSIQGKILFSYLLGMRARRTYTEPKFEQPVEKNVANESSLKALEVIFVKSKSSL